MGPGCVRIHQSMGMNPQGELEYAKKDVDSLGDGMLILKKHKRQRRSCQHHLQEGICPICKRKVVRSLFDYTICKKESIPFLGNEQIMRSQHQSLRTLRCPF